MLFNNHSRRTFLKTGIGAAVAAACAPLVLAEDKSVTETIIGSGQHTYRVDSEWAKLPHSVQFGNTHGVCETADNRIFIHNASPTGDSVCEFDPDGKFIRAWGPEYKTGAHGMQLRKEGNEEFLYLAATGQHICAKTDLEGKLVWKIEYPKEAMNADGKPCYESEKKFVPTNIAFHPTDGSFYVSDGYGSNYVHHYSADAKYLSTFGGPGKKEGQLSCPHGIWCDTRDASNPRLVVADRANVRLQYFTLDGKYLSMVTENLRHPCHFDQRGDELLIPDLHGRLTIFDKDNKLVLHLGDNADPKTWSNGYPQDKLVPGKFNTPHEAIWDHNGNIYCVEWLHYGRVTKLTRMA